MRISKTLKSARLPYCTAVLLAGGNGSRFGSDKLLADLDGIPVFGRSLKAFSDCDCIQEIIIVAREDILPMLTRQARLYGRGKVRLLVPGGASRLYSAYAGVFSVSSKSRLIAIHDAARPLVSANIIEETLWAAYRNHAAAPAILLKDTVKQIQDDIVSETLDRDKLRAVQTPQVFQSDIIKAALQNAVDRNISVTDDCSAAEAIGAKITLTTGSEENIKITTPLDLEVAKLILQRRKT